MSATTITEIRTPRERAMIADQHAPVAELNTTGQGIRTFVRCRCGEHPHTMPAGARQLTRWHDAHRRSLDMPPADFSLAVYGDSAHEGARGLTRAEWRAVSGGERDPWTGRDYDDLFAACLTSQR